MQKKIFSRENSHQHTSTSWNIFHYFLPYELKMSKENGKGRWIPSTRNIHEPHGNSYTRKHQQGHHGTNKKRWRSRTKAQVWKKITNTCLLKNLRCIVEDSIYTRELHWFKEELYDSPTKIVTSNRAKNLKMFKDWLMNEILLI